MDDDDGPQQDHVTKGRRPLKAWLAAALYLLQAAVEQAAQTAWLLVSSALVVCQAMAWRGHAVRR